MKSKSGFRLLGIVFILLMALMALTMPAIAQDGLSGDVTPLPDNGSNGGVVAAPEPGFSLPEFFAGLAAGGIGALIGVFGIVGRIKNDKAALDAIEWLGKSIPVDALAQLNELGKALRDAGEVIDRVTDGKPNDFPTPQQSIPIREMPGATPSG